jgi:hypothetical protein
VSVAVLDPTFLNKPSVAKYQESLGDLDPGDRERRLEIIAGFSQYTERDPDLMIEEIFDEESRKYRKRGFYSEKAKEYAATFEEPASVRLQRSNVVRAFFIANGRRLLPEQPDWMQAN